MQVYNDDGSTELTLNDGTVKKYTEFENWVIDQMIREYKKSNDTYRTPRPHELAEIFPDAKEYLNQRKKDIATLLAELLESDRKIIADTELSKFKNKDLKEYKLSINKSMRDSLIRERDENHTILSFMSPKKNKTVRNFHVELSKAKAYPIDKLLTFKRNVAHCLWHTDKNPSLYYYKKDNRVYCFVCARGGDSVDVVMQQRGCSMGEAISFLNQTA